MSPAPQLLDPDLVALAAQTEPVPAYPDQGHHVRGIAFQQAGNPRFGAGLAGLPIS